MRKTADVQLWSEEVARDPGAPAFAPLARMYRHQGRRDAALRVCLRGLESNPAHVEGHAILALLYLEAGDRERARDEWATALRLDPDNFEGHRGIGFLDLERGAFEDALRHLERASAANPEDMPVRDALRLARDKAMADEAPPARTQAGRDPRQVFASLSGDAPYLGALVLDAHGLVLAGDLEGEARRAEMLGAVLGSALTEARRTSKHLGIGDWGGLLLESDQVMVHVTPLAEDTAVLLLARKGAPAGWVLRMAKRATALARVFLEQA
ncbi:MAG: roadblock/LC7 domain-containing protein [Gemmatimonadota bacterium]|jgi:tetratricopeptide (TPR) repeat protein